MIPNLKRNTLSLCNNTTLLDYNATTQRYLITMITMQQHNGTYETILNTPHM
jgi:hypothetical protein